MKTISVRSSLFIFYILLLFCFITISFNEFSFHFISFDFVVDDVAVAAAGAKVKAAKINNPSSFQQINHIHIYAHPHRANIHLRTQHTLTHAHSMHISYCIVVFLYYLFHRVTLPHSFSIEFIQSFRFDSRLIVHYESAAAVVVLAIFVVVVVVVFLFFWTLSFHDVSTCHNTLPNSTYT